MDDTSANYVFKKGDVVEVYSLQSFFYGGFINGTVGVVRQDQTGGSVLVRVKRYWKGAYQEDESYEVYPQQLRLVRPAKINDVSKKDKTKKKKDKIINLLKKIIYLLEQK